MEKIYTVYRFTENQGGDEVRELVGICHDERDAWEVVREDDATDDQMMFLQGWGASGRPNEEECRWEIWEQPTDCLMDDCEAVKPEHSFPERVHGWRCECEDEDCEDAA